MKRRSAALRRLTLGVLALAFLVSMTIGGCASTQQPAAPKPAPEAPKPVSVLRYAMHRDAIGIDPHISSAGTMNVLQANVYDKLVEYSPDGKIIGELAEKWEVPDPTTYVFYLRKGVKFHNGNPLAADDVKCSFDRIMDPKTGAADTTYLKGVKEIKIVDDYTIRFTLSAPNATFLNTLTSNSAGIIDKEWFDKGNDPKKVSNGTGPFMLKGFEPQVKYELVKNPNYWKANKNYVDQLTLIPIQDDNARVNALLKGEVDFAEYIPWQMMDSLAKDPKFVVTKGYDNYNIVRLNTSRPPLNNPKVCQALNYIIDRTAISKIAWGGQALPMSELLIPEGNWAFNQDIKGVWKTDHAKARQLLKEAGYSSPDKLRLLFESSDLVVHIDTAQVIENQLSAFGIKIDFKVIDSPTLLAKRTSGDYMMMMDGLSNSMPDPDTYYRYYHSTAGAGQAVAVKYKIPQLDALLEKGQTLTDQAQRQKVYAEAEKLLIANPPWIFGVWRPQAEAYYAYVKGYVPLGSGLRMRSPGFMETVRIEK